ANVPIMREVALPPQLFTIDPRRVVGLTVQPGQLIAYRQRRGQHLGLQTGTGYTAPDQLLDELEYARSVCRRANFAIIDTTDKPIEECADEILAQVARRLKL
ncbi:MAG: kinase/pyrophosphorylase, partial [Anaerolinea sp.]|nr:kinase/pyrophosphorylase [Anaerolinea sp.]